MLFSHACSFAVFRIAFLIKLIWENLFSNILQFHLSRWDGVVHKNEQIWRKIVIKNLSLGAKKENETLLSFRCNDRRKIYPKMQINGTFFNQRMLHRTNSLRGKGMINAGGVLELVWFVWKGQMENTEGPLSQKFE